MGARAPGGGVGKERGGCRLVNFFFFIETVSVQRSTTLKWAVSIFSAFWNWGGGSYYEFYAQGFGNLITLT